MGIDNSTEYWLGWADGERDEARIKECPPQAPIGPDPPFNPSPNVTHVMYLQGYFATYTGNAHTCTLRCRQVVAR